MSEDKIHAYAILLKAEIDALLYKDKPDIGSLDSAVTTTGLTLLEGDAVINALEEVVRTCLVAFPPNASGECRCCKRPFPKT